MSRRILYVLVLAASLAFLRIDNFSQTNSIVIPKEAATGFGSTWADPFFNYARVEQIYAASEFSALPEDVVAITGVAFRPNESSSGPLDALLRRLQLSMNVFRGSMQEAVERQSGVESPIELVFDKQDVHLTGRVGPVQSLGVRLPFQKPFIYDRRLGQLVLEIDPEGFRSGQPLSMDAFGFLGQFDRGAHIAFQLNSREKSAVIMVTEFTYQTLFARIDSFRQADSLVQVDFTLVGNPKLVQIESAPVVIGPYTIEEGAELSRIGDGKMRAVLSTMSNRFFRVRLE